MALAASLQHLGEQFDNQGAFVLGDALEVATADYLENQREPSRKVNELDNRGSSFYLTLYRARALAAQTGDAELAGRFKVVADPLGAAEETIVAELNGAQGPPQDLDGYYMPDADKALAAMRPSPTFNAIIDGI